MVTTIQLHESVKNGLDRLKETGKESYEDIILKLMILTENQKRKKEALLIEQCKIMASDSIEVVKEWRDTDTELGWKWEHDGNKKRRDCTC
ncbi:MAG: hypothetical protein AABX65_01875 [Nanoarchaeota archaeon]